MSSSERASAMVMIYVVILYHPKTSGAEATFSALSSCVESSAQTGTKLRGVDRSLLHKT
jgi:hypothetical protein